MKLQRRPPVRNGGRLLAGRIRHTFRPRSNERTVRDPTDGRIVTTDAAWLLAALMVAHYLADFTGLATARMQEAKSGGGPASVIAGHAAVHGLLMAPIIVLLGDTSIARAGWLAAVVVGSHFLIDLTRARAGVRFAPLRDPNGKPFWAALGLDQLLHGLVLVWVVTRVA